MVTLDTPPILQCLRAGDHLMGSQQMECSGCHITLELQNVPDGNSITCTSCTGDLLAIHLPDSEYTRQF